MTNKKMVRQKKKYSQLLENRLKIFVSIVKVQLEWFKKLIIFSNSFFFLVLIIFLFLGMFNQFQTKPLKSSFLLLSFTVSHVKRTNAVVFAYRYNHSGTNGQINRYSQYWCTEYNSVAELVQGYFSVE